MQSQRMSQRPLQSTIRCSSCMDAQGDHGQGSREGNLGHIWHSNIRSHVAPDADAISPAPGRVNGREPKGVKNDS